MPPPHLPGAWPRAIPLRLGLACASLVLLGACGNEPSPSTAGDAGDVELDGSADDSHDAGAPKLPLDDAGPNESGAIDASVVPDDAGKNLPTESGTDPMAPRIVRGAPQQTYWDLVIRGVGLSEYEGRQVTVLIGRSERPPERLGLATTKIAGGTFELSFPQVWEVASYKVKRAFIDVDQNGRCDANTDLLFRDERGTLFEALQIRTELPVMRADVPRAPDAAADCAALNAPFPSE